MPRDILEQASALLVSDLEAPPTIDDVARAVGLSRCHLTRAFAKHFGIPPHRFLMRARVHRARALLEGGAGAAEVAFSCGFYDQSHLTRWFKRLLGITPGKVSRPAGSAGPMRDSTAARDD